MVYSQVVGSCGPLTHNVVKVVLAEWVAFSVGEDDAFKRLRVDHRLDQLLVVADNVVVKFNTSRLLLVNNDISNLQEILINLAIVIVELLAALNTTRTLVGLKNDQELSDELTTFFHQVLLVKMNEEIAILSDLKVNNL